MPGADHFIPRLTTVRQDLETLGQRCIDILLAALNEGPGDLRLVEPTFVLRESTAEFHR